MDITTKEVSAFKDSLGKKISKGSSAIKSSDTLERLWKEFSFDLEGSHRTEQTIATYLKHYHKLCEFVGYTALEASGETPDYKKDRDRCRALGEQYPISVLDTPMIGAHYHSFLESVCKISEQSVISGMRNFRRFVYWATENEIIEGQKVKVSNVEPSIKDTFSKEEIFRLTARQPNPEDMVDYRCWIMCLYLLSTGNRIGSVLALNVEDINFEENTIRVQVTKNREPLIIGIQEKLKRPLSRWIRTYREENGNYLYGEPLFPNRYGERLSYDACSDAMADYFNRHGVKWEGFHKFRHSYAANWIRDGGDSLTLKAQLGHKSLAMTNRYANLYGTAVAKEANEHALINKVEIKSGRKAIKPNFK